MVREERKEARRQRTLNAAATLIRETGSTDFSMVILAGKAKLSPATPYNLFGSKGAILYALLNRCLDEISGGAEKAIAHRSPFLRAIRAAAWGASFFVSDPDFYRPLYRFLLGVEDPVYRPAYMDRSLEYWKFALAEMDSGAVALPKEVDNDALARQLLIQFTGALDLWVQKELDDREFVAQIGYGAGLILLGIASDEHREAILKNMRAQRKQLPKAFSFAQAK